MTTSIPSTTATGAGTGPKPVPQPVQQSEAVKEKKDLTSWWKNFKRGDKKGQEQVAPQGIFGVPLHTSIIYANVAISLFNEEGRPYIYGYVPIVVAKCGVYLKEKATDVEGIFRLAGSEKRIKELRVAFDSPDRYGKGLDWTGYTVHDAANILRRYFNQLPEPIIPLEFYQKFRDPIRNHQAQAVGPTEAQSSNDGDFHHDAAIKAYQDLITELPPLNRQLLLYILDLLAVFASKSQYNKMTTNNLAAIFQPGILSHPQHDMAPHEYLLSQNVLIFLIENQDNFLIGMAGTAADKDTVRDVQSGTSIKTPGTPTTPNRSKTVIGRSSSNSSVAADSVRKWGSIRRNVSTSSKHSKRSEQGPSPGTPSSQSPTGGVHRSNTVPSRRGGSAAQSPRFSRDKHSDPSTPNPASGSFGHNIQADATAPVVSTNTVQNAVEAERPSSIQNTPTTTSMSTFPAPPEVTYASSSEVTTPLANVSNDVGAAENQDFQTPKRDDTPLLAPTSERTNGSSSTTPSTMARKGLLDIFSISPSNDGDGRKPNKLQKRRTPGSALSSAQSSSHSLHEDAGDRQRSPISSSIVASTITTAATDAPQENGENASYSTTQTTPPSQSTPQRQATGATLKPTISPSNSFQSHTDTSDADMVGDDMPAPGEEELGKKKRHRWRFSRTQNKVEPPLTPGNPLSSISAKEQAMSRSTIGSGGSQPRRSFQEPTPIAAVATEPVPGQGLQATATTDTVFSDSERERKGPVSWLRNKLSERKDKDVEKRSRTPERDLRHERSKSRLDAEVSGSDAQPARKQSIEHRASDVATSPGGPLSSTGPQPLPKSAAVSAAVVAANGDHAPQTERGDQQMSSGIVAVGSGQAPGASAGAPE